eukprot:11217508-Lingulodinium_polyedra.AAC.1
MPARPWFATPRALLIEVVDCIEVCCGAEAPFIAVMAKEGRRVGPRINVQQDAAWDIISAQHR